MNWNPCNREKIATVGNNLQADMLTACHNFGREAGRMARFTSCDQKKPNFFGL